MKILILASAILLAGCVSDGQDYPHRVGGMENSGVGVAYGIGPSYNRPQGNARELTKAELDYVNANKVDFQVVQRENTKANMAIFEKEIAGLKEANKISCEDIAAIGYQVLVNKAWEAGDWSSVQSYDTKNVIARCHANRGQ